MQAHDGAQARDRGNSTRILIDGLATQGRFALIEIRERQGAGALCHLHRSEDEAIYVLEGDVAFEMDGERITGSAGTCVFLAARSEHGYTVTSDEARLLVIVSPAGLEDLYQEAREPGAPGPRDIEHLASLAARYGIDITGPAPAMDQ